MNINKITSLAELSDDDERSLKNLSNRFRKQFDLIAENEKSLEKLDQSLSEKINDICNILEIPIVEGDQSVLQGKKTNTHKKTTVRLDGSMAMKNAMEQIEGIPDLSSIRGKVTKVSSLGIFIDIGINEKINVSNIEIKKVLKQDQNDVFKIGDEVKVQILDKKRVVVEVTV